MTIRQYMVDAFTDRVFKGNQAAVCVTDHILDDALMQSIAIENNFSETAFLVPGEGDSDTVPSYRLRWFTPGGEINLCGHATLAAAYVVGRFLHPNATSVLFSTCSGEIPVGLNGEWISMDMPAFHLRPIPVTDEMEKAFGARPVEAWMDRDLICVMPSKEDVLSIAPNADMLSSLDGLGQCATARAEDADDADFVSRFFAPKLDVLEDPVCGSVHCALTPLWAQKLSKAALVARQLSRRGGVLKCELDGERVRISGKAALFATADLALADGSEAILHE